MNRRSLPPPPPPPPPQHPAVLHPGEAAQHPAVHHARLGGRHLCLHEPAARAAQGRPGAAGQGARSTACGAVQCCARWWSRLQGQQRQEARRAGLCRAAPPGSRAGWSPSWSRASGARYAPCSPRQGYSPCTSAPVVALGSLGSSRQAGKPATPSACAGVRAQAGGGGCLQPGPRLPQLGGGAQEAVPRAPAGRPAVLAPAPGRLLRLQLHAGVWGHCSASRLAAVQPEFSCVFLMEFRLVGGKICGLTSSVGRAGERA